MKIPMFQVDTFTTNLFSGNPAAVCPLEQWLPDLQMQLIAAENNLSETAFFVDQGTHYELRWFTPTTEVDLCGHATLASAFVVLNYLKPFKNIVRFKTKSGTLLVKRNGKLFSMDFPCRCPKLCNSPKGLIDALGKKPNKVFVSRDYMAVFNSEDDIVAIEPDMTLLKRLDRLGVIITAAGKKSDFVSRFFAPKVGILEDPVTGSSHCTLVPYWSKQLCKTKLRAFQFSKRKGELICEHVGNRVRISGKAVLYLKGLITIV